MAWREDAEITTPAEESRQMTCCPGKRRMYRVYVPGVEGVWAPAVHSNCQHNELVSMGLRTFAETPADPKDPATRRVVWSPYVVAEFKRLRLLVKKLNVSRLSRGEVVAGYSGAMARKYRVAQESLELDELSSRDFELSAFLKGEKFNPLSKFAKPRMINPRSARYNLCIAQRLKPLEHAIWNNWKHGSLCKPTRVSGKGLSGSKRAELILEKMAAVGDCVVVEVDGKAFEAHVTVEQMTDLEHPIYRAAFPGDSELSRLLRAQLKLSGRTASGVRFSRPGCRASGDFNTGLGNTLLMGSFVIAAMQSLDFATPWTTLADGDNCLLFFRRSELPRVQRDFSPALSSLCAHEMTVEKPAHCLEEVCFGQSHPVRVAQGLVMVREPFKVLSNAFSGYRHYHDRRFAPRLVRAIAQAEQAQNRGVPILGPYFSEVVRLTTKYKSLRDPSFFLEGHLLGVGPDPGFIPVTDEARNSFALAFGLGVEEQLVLERDLLFGLRRDLLSTLDSGRWLDHVEEVFNGKTLTDSDSARSWLYFDG